MKLLSLQKEKDRADEAEKKITEWATELQKWKGVNKKTKIKLDNTLQTNQTLEKEKAKLLALEAEKQQLTEQKIALEQKVAELTKTNSEISMRVQALTSLKGARPGVSAVAPPKTAPAKPATSASARPATAAVSLVVSYDSDEDAPVNLDTDGCVERNVEG